MILSSTLKLAAITLPFLIQAQSGKYTCGEKRKVTRPYGNVELRVDCETAEGRMWVSEYKRDTLHGMSQGFRLPSRIRKDSCFFQNGKEHGTCLVWDTLGNVVGRSIHRNGKQIGKQEIYFSVGRPAIIKHFNDKGEEEGSWEVWWPNGNKKAEYMAKGGLIVSGTEYYPNGKPRVRYATKYEPEVKSAFKTKHIEAEAWTPNGRSTGQIINGNGEWTHFSAEPDKKTGRYNVFREVYKDSLMIKGEELDSTEVARWLK